MVLELHCSASQNLPLTSSEARLLDGTLGAKTKSIERKLNSSCQQRAPLLHQAVVMDVVMMCHHGDTGLSVKIMGAAKGTQAQGARAQAARVAVCASELVLMAAEILLVSGPTTPPIVKPCNTVKGFWMMMERDITPKLVFSAAEPFLLA